MADSVTTSTANSSQNKANPSVSQAQTSQPTTSSSSTTAAPHVDTKVRNAGASLAEFLTQLEDYTPTVHFSLNYVLNFIGISFFPVSICWTAGKDILDVPWEQNSQNHLLNKTDNNSSFCYSVICRYANNWPCIL